jgi:hypothetical protein
MCFQTKDVRVRWITEEEGNWGLVKRVGSSSAEGGVVDNSDSMAERVLGSGSVEAIVCYQWMTTGMSTGTAKAILFVTDKGG